MKLAKINMNSTAEVKGEFSDVVFFQGCSRNCIYCFNPELKENGVSEQEKGYKELAQALYHSFSGVVVLTGGEPLDQPKEEIFRLIKLLKYNNKKVVVETSKYDREIFNIATHVLYTIKTWDINTHALVNTSNMKNVTPLVISDHKDFVWSGYMELFPFFDTIYFRPVNDTMMGKSWVNMYKLAKKYKTELKRFKQICLSKKNSTK